MLETLELLIEDEELRRQVGGAARSYVENNRTDKHVAVDWERAFDRILED